MITFKKFLLEEEKIQFDLTKTGRKDWDSTILHDSDYIKKIIYMSPDEFLTRVYGRRHSNFQIDNKKVQQIKKSINKKKQNYLHQH